MSTRLEIREDFRVENPEIDENVITDAQLNTWAKKANKEICAITRCIVTNTSETFNSVVDTQYYDLSDKIDQFFEIDDIPGGGVYYDGKPLKKATPSELNQFNSSWKSRTSGTPKKWWRRGKYLWFDWKPSAIKVISVDAVLIPDDFSDDDQMPYNNLEHLSPYDEGIQKYLQWKAKAKIGKTDEAAIAKAEYAEYTKWMKKMVAGYSNAGIYLRPSSGQSG